MDKQRNRRRWMVVLAVLGLGALEAGYAIVGALEGDSARAPADLSVPATRWANLRRCLVGAHGGRDGLPASLRAIAEAEQGARAAEPSAGLVTDRWPARCTPQAEALADAVDVMTAERAFVFTGGEAFAARQLVVELRRDHVGAAFVDLWDRVEPLFAGVPVIVDLAIPEPPAPGVPLIEPAALHALGSDVRLEAATRIGGHWTLRLSNGRTCRITHDAREVECPFDPDASLPLRRALLVQSREPTWDVVFASDDHLGASEERAHAVVYDVHTGRPGSTFSASTVVSAARVGAVLYGIVHEEERFLVARVDASGESVGTLPPSTVDATVFDRWALSVQESTAGDLSVSAQQLSSTGAPAGRIAMVWRDLPARPRQGSVSKACSAGGTSWLVLDTSGGGGAALRVTGEGAAAEWSAAPFNGKITDAFTLSCDAQHVRVAAMGQTSVAELVCDSSTCIEEHHSAQFRGTALAARLGEQMLLVDYEKGSVRFTLTAPPSLQSAAPRLLLSLGAEVYVRQMSLLGGSDRSAILFASTARGTFLVGFDDTGAAWPVRLKPAPPLSPGATD